MNVSELHVLYFLRKYDSPLHVHSTILQPHLTWACLRKITGNFNERYMRENLVYFNAEQRMKCSER